MTPKHRSPIFELSDQYITEAATLSPIGATFLGIKGYDDQLDDFSLAGSEKYAQLVRRTLQKLAGMQPQDEIDRIAKAVMDFHDQAFQSQGFIRCCCHAGVFGGTGSNHDQS